MGAFKNYNGKSLSNMPICKLVLHMYVKIPPATDVVTKSVLNVVRKDATVTNYSNFQDLRFHAWERHNALGNQEHLHTFHLFMSIKTTNLWSQQHAFLFLECIFM